jgi:hypothetical protein
MKKEIKVQQDKTSFERRRREKLLEIYKKCPIPDSELLSNLALFISKTEFSRMLYIHEIYRKILDVHGIITEFGVRWGQNLALFETFRGIYEPFNQTRKIVGFDTFEGFPSVSAKDGASEIVSKGSYSVTENYELYLDGLLELHEQEGVITPSKRYELIKGDASHTIKDYLKKHPETIISLAYFDFDIYEPTCACLEAIQGYVTRGTIIAFDELNYDVFPGETIALKEVFGLDKYKLVHTPYSSSRSYLVID